MTSELDGVDVPIIFSINHLLNIFFFSIALSYPTIPFYILE